METLKWIAPGEDFSEPLAVRMAVFVKEQRFDNEVDEIDKIAYHLVFYDDAGGPAACGRIFPDKEREGTFIIGRVAVMKHLRCGGIGRKLMAAMEEKAVSLGANRFYLSAQQQARAFYEKMGYQSYGEPYLDEHCQHIHMEKWKRQD